MLEFLFKKVGVLQVYNFIKKRLQHRCFAVNIAKFLRSTILKNIYERLLLELLFRNIPTSELEFSAELQIAEISPLSPNKFKDSRNTHRNYLRWSQFLVQLWMGGLDTSNCLRRTLLKMSFWEF